MRPFSVTVFVVPDEADLAHEVSDLTRTDCRRSYSVYALISESESFSISWNSHDELFLWASLRQPVLDGGINVQSFIFIN